MGLNERYQDKLRNGELKPDSGQEAVLAALARLAEALEAMPAISRPSLFNFRFSRNPSQVQKGVYIYGPVGRGKTMVMDLFFDSVSFAEKRRVHFHAFMQEVHQTRAQIKTGDVISQIARQLSDHIRLLCLDEMQITDIADAMIIGRLYEALLQRGVTLVTTANLPPDELYRDGLNRQHILPFLARLEATMTVVSLDSQRDYRLGRIKARDSYIFPLGPSTEHRMAKLWDDLTDQAVGLPADLSVLGRTLHVPRAAKTCARFSFAELCEQPLGAPDYLALAEAYPVIFLDHIPKLKKSDRNAAKRFILLIDTLYDQGRKLVASAATAPEDIYPVGDHHFEFSRTISRLKEMQSASWWGGKIAET
jgi:cell division protein ZapE